MIKIVGGKYKTRVIETPEGETLPTKNMVREAISSALRNEIIDANVLDLFAGSGAMGIEFLSRGAKSCVFNDTGKQAYLVIKRNLEILQIQGGGVFNLDYLECLKRCKDSKFDLVFLDPPYKLKESYQNSIDYLFDNNMLSEEAVIVLEYEGELEVDQSRFASVREYKYGKTKVKILRRESL